MTALVDLQHSGFCIIILHKLNVIFKFVVDTIPLKLYFIYSERNLKMFIILFKFHRNLQKNIVT